MNRTAMSFCVSERTEERLKPACCTTSVLNKLSFCVPFISVTEFDFISSSVCGSKSQMICKRNWYFMRLQIFNAIFVRRNVRRCPLSVGMFPNCRLLPRLCLAIAKRSSKSMLFSLSYFLRDDVFLLPQVRFLHLVRNSVPGN